MRVAKSVLSRLFLLENGASPDRVPEYLYFIAPTSFDEKAGGVDEVSVTDPNTGEQIVIGFGASDGRQLNTVSVETLFNLDRSSRLSDISGVTKRHDFHIHFGECDDPAVFNTYDRAVILEDAVVLGVSVSDSGTLSNDGNAATSESAEISASRIYHAYPTDIRQLALHDDGLGDMAMSYNNDRKKWRIFASASRTGGIDDLLYSGDSGGSWSVLSFFDNTWGGTLAPSENYLIAFNSSPIQYSYISYDTLETDEVIVPTVVSPITIASLVSGQVRGVWSVGATTFLSMQYGEVWKLHDSEIDIGATNRILDRYVLTELSLNSIHGLSEEYIVTAGVNSVIGFTENGGKDWTVCTEPAGPNVNITALHIESKDLWWLGTDQGRILYTTDQGDTYKLSYMQPSGNTIMDINFSTKSVGFASISDEAHMKTIDGGQSWFNLPDGKGNPVIDKETLKALVIPGDPNTLYSGGQVSGLGKGEPGDWSIVHYGLSRPVRDPIDYTARVAKLDPLAYWRMNEDPLLSAAVWDSSGNGYHGFHPTEPSITTNVFAPKPSDSTVSYNGVDEYTNLYSSGFASAFDGGLFTVSLWFRVSSGAVWHEFPGNRTLLHWGKDTSNEFALGKTNKLGYGSIIATHQANGNPSETINEITVKPSDWAHVAMVVDGDNDRWSLWVNGEEIDEITGSNCDSFVNPLANTFVHVGRNNTPANYWSGHIAHIAVFDKVLVPLQILDLADRA